jgi:hypothetical protein
VKTFAKIAFVNMQLNFKPACLLYTILTLHSLQMLFRITFAQMLYFSIALTGFVWHLYDSLKLSLTIAVNAGQEVVWQ